jgi:homoserine dehydrogenase
VVTGNKALLAERGVELMALAERENVPLYCEAAVAGGIPIIKAVGEALVGNRIESIYGIINGTSNYILTRMQEAGLPFAEALREAQELGYAEADPALDINGWDAAHKAIILAWLSHGRWPNPRDISVEGITSVDPADVAFARRLGYHIKLVGVVKPGPSGAVEVRVQPSLLPRRHVLAHIRGVQNALAVRGDVVGETLYAGPGAGQDATSSSVIADLADAAHNISRGTSYDGFLPHGSFGVAVPVEETVSEYYLRLEVADQPGTIAQITAVLGRRGIGILSIIQPDPGAPNGAADPAAPESGAATLVLTLHHAAYGNVTGALAEIETLPCTRRKPVFYRVESL